MPARQPVSRLRLPSILARSAAAFLILLSFGASLRAANDANLSDWKAAQARCQAQVERLTAATVGILNPDLAGPNALGYGSGVVVSEDGIVLTAGHVLSKPNSELIIVFSDGRRAKAIALGADRSRDAGMAKITDPGKYPHVELGKSGDLKVDQWCLAMGHPGGVEEGRTPPIRLGRILQAGKGRNLNDCICTDCTMISGDSGGPLFDLDGKLIGIHSSIGIMVTQNRHVPVDVFTEVWKDLLAGKQTGKLPEGMTQHRPAGPSVSPELVEKFQRLLREHIRAGDPEVLQMAKGGQLKIDGPKMKELVAKWESPAVADKTPLDFLKFHRMFEDRLIAGDKDVQGLIKDGKMLLTPAQMHDLYTKWDAEAAKKAELANGIDKEKFQKLLIRHALAGDPDAIGLFKRGQVVISPDKMKELTAKWEKDPKTSVADDAEVDEMLKHVRFRPDGGVEFGITPESEDKLLPLLIKLGLVPGGSWMNAGKREPAIVSTLTSIVAGAEPSVVTVLSDGKPVSLGTVVRKDGYIVAKASELHDKLTCKIGKRELPAKIVKKNDDLDVALLKVEADDLKPIKWADGDAPKPGTWLAVAGTDDKPLGLGIVSVAARPIPREPTMVIRNTAALGVLLATNDETPKIESMRPGSPAEKGGLKAADVIVALNGKEVTKSSEVRAMLSKFTPGEKITLDVKRGDEKKQLTVELGSASKLSAPPGDIGAHHLDAMSSKGGTVSKRNNNFALALTHDVVVQATQCGGPVVDLDGHVIGLDIARADRTATYAIPAAKAKAMIEEMLPK